MIDLICLTGDADKGKQRASPAYAIHKKLTQHCDKGILPGTTGTKRFVTPPERRNGRNIMRDKPYLVSCLTMPQTQQCAFARIIRQEQVWVSFILPYQQGYARSIRHGMSFL